MPRTPRGLTPRGLPSSSRPTRETKEAGFSPRSRGDRYSSTTQASGFAGIGGLEVVVNYTQEKTSDDLPTYAHMSMGISDPLLQVKSIEVSVGGGLLRRLFYKSTGGSIGGSTITFEVPAAITMFRDGETFILEDTGTASDGTYTVNGTPTFQDTNADGLIDQMTVVVDETFPATFTTGHVHWATINIPVVALDEDGVAALDQVLIRNVWHQMSPTSVTVMRWRVGYMDHDGVLKYKQGSHVFDYDNVPEFKHLSIEPANPDGTDNGTPIWLRYGLDDDGLSIAYVWDTFAPDNTTNPDWDIGETVGAAGASTLGYVKGYNNAQQATIFLGYAPHNTIVKVRVIAYRKATLTDAIAHDDGDYMGQETVVFYENHLVVVPQVFEEPSQNGPDARMKLNIKDPQSRVSKVEYNFRYGDIYNESYNSWNIAPAEVTPDVGYDATYHIGYEGAITLEEDFATIILYRVFWKDDEGTEFIISGNFTYDFDDIPGFNTFNLGWKIDNTTANRYPEYIQVDYEFDEDANYLNWGFAAVASNGLIGGTHSTPEAYFAANPPSNQVPASPTFPGGLGGSGSLLYDGIDQSQIDIAYGEYGWFCFEAWRSAWAGAGAGIAAKKGEVIYRQVRRISHIAPKGADTEIAASILTTGGLPDWTHIDFDDTVNITGGTYEYPDGKYYTLPSGQVTLPDTTNWYYVYYDVDPVPGYAVSADLSAILAGDTNDIIVASVKGGTPPQIYNWLSLPFINDTHIAVASLDALFGRIETLNITKTLNIVAGGEFVAGTSTDGVIIDDAGIRGVASGVTQFSLDVSTGAATAGGGAVVLDDDGVTILAPSAAGETVRSVIWSDGTNDIAKIDGHAYLGDNGTLTLRAYEPPPHTGYADINIAAQVPGSSPFRSASIDLYAGTSWSSAINLVASDSLYYNSLSLAGGVAQFTLTSGGYISIGYGGSEDQYRLPVDVGLTGQALVKTSGGALLQWISVQQSDPMLDDIAALTDPGVDRLLFWDDSAGSISWLGLDSKLSISTTTLAPDLSVTWDFSDGIQLTGGTPTATAGKLSLFANSEEMPEAYIGTTGPLPLPVTWYNQYTESSITNTSTETTLMHASGYVGTKSLPAGHLVQGTSFTWEAGGDFTEADGVVSSLTFRIKIGSVTVDTFQANFSAGLYTDRPWYFRAHVTVVSVSGTTAQVRVVGSFHYSSTGTAWTENEYIYGSSTVAVTSIDTSLALDLTGAITNGGSSTTATLTCSNILVMQTS